MTIFPTVASQLVPNPTCSNFFKRHNASLKSIRFESTLVIQSKLLSIVATVSPNPSLSLIVPSNTINNYTTKIGEELGFGTSWDLGRVDWLPLPTQSSFRCLMKHKYTIDRKSKQFVGDHKLNIFKLSLRLQIRNQLHKISIN